MIIVNFSTPNYARGQNRLKESVKKYNNLMYSSYEEIGSPTHQESPYEFKIHAIEKAFEHDDIVLWCDASLWLVGDLSVIEQLIINDGYMLTEAGHYCGRWVNKFQREYMKLTDAEAVQGPGGLFMFSAGFVGLNKNSPVAMEFLKQWKQAGKDGAFRGSWDESRHEMVIGSIIAQRLGMKYQRGGKLLSYVGPGYSTPESGSVFYLQGMH